MQPKSRLRLKVIPRLESTAAVVVARQHRKIQEELGIDIHKVIFWTDSTCVLQYIKNEASRFKSFMVNTIGTIHEILSPSQWRYLTSEVNPADYASGGLSPSEDVKVKHWIHGPRFLYENEIRWPESSKSTSKHQEQLKWKKSAELFEAIVSKAQPLD